MPAENPSTESPLPSDSRRQSFLWLKVALVGLIVVAVIAALLRDSRSDADLRQEATEAAAARNWDQALATLERMHSRTPEDALLRASVHLALKNPKAARADVELIPLEGPLTAQRFLALGQIEQAEFHARAMEANLLKAIEKEPKLVPARRLLVYLYGVQERRKELLEQFARLVELGPLTVDLVLHWSISRGQIGDAADALRDLSKFVAADPADRNSRLALAEVSRRLGKLDQAIEYLELLPSDDPDALAIRTQVEFDRGDNKKGDALLARGPAGHPVLNRLRGRRALARRDGPAAVKFLQEANSADPDNMETLFVLAQALRLDGKKEEADQVSAKASAHQSLRSLLADFSNRTTDPQPETFKKIAAASEAVGFIPEAIAWYRLAVTANPLDSDAQKAIYRLKSKL